MKALVGGVALIGSVAFLGSNIPSVSPITNPPIRQSGLEAHDESATGSLPPWINSTCAPSSNGRSAGRW